MALYTLNKHSFICQIYLYKAGNRKKRKPSLGIPDVKCARFRLEASWKAEVRLPGNLGQGEAWITKGTHENSGVV